MSRYPLGQPVRLSTTVRDLSNTLVDAGAISLVLQRPDGTQQTYAAPTHDGLGLYHQDVPATDLVTVGHYPYKWVATGTGAGVTPPASLDIYDPFEPEVLSLTDLKTQLGIAATDTSKDAELVVFAATAVQVIEDLIGGPFLNRAVTETVCASDGGRALVLSTRGLISVQSITDQQSGSASSVTQVLVDPVSGVIRQKAGVPFYWYGPYTVVVIAGRGTAVPPVVNTAARIIAQQLWDTRRGPSARPGLGGDDLVVTSFGYAVPRRALQLLSGYLEEAVVG